MLINNEKITSFIVALIICISSLSLAACGCSHENGQETIIVEPTCTTVGQKEFYCYDCKETFTFEIPTIEHDYSVLVSDTATCQSSGNITYQCSMCESTRTESSAKKEHDYAGSFCKYCKKIKDEFNKININSGFDDLYNYYTHQTGSYIIFLDATEGSTQIKMTVFASGNYSCNIFLVITLVNNTTKSYEATLMKSGRLKYNSLTTLSDTETMSAAYDSSNEYYISLSITVL